MNRAFVSERKELTLVLPELEYQVLWCVHLAKAEAAKAGNLL